MKIRVQIKNTGNSKLIAELKKKSTLVKRTGIQPSTRTLEGQMSDHLGVAKEGKGFATFDIDINLINLLPNNGYVVLENSRVSVKQYKEDNNSIFGGEA
jgi:hypothetical protein|tara:strand:- start:2 stop:298 length:297 start_codon:yes stop_codon:yes gene_type:complete